MRGQADIEQNSRTNKIFPAYTAGRNFLGMFFLCRERKEQSLLFYNSLRVPKPRLWKSAPNLPKTFGSPERGECVRLIIIRASKTTLFTLSIINCAWQNRAFSSERSAAFSHCPLGQCSHVRSAPPLPKNLTSLRFSGTLFSAPNLPKTFGSPERGECVRRTQRGKRLSRKGSGCPLKLAQTAASLLRGLRETKKI